MQQAEGRKFDFQAINHQTYMRKALREAELAMQAGERPIGAVIVHRGRIIARGRARHRGDRNPLAHAELIALQNAASYLYDHPHEDGIIYTTLEPCEMCLGAIVMSDCVNHIVFSMEDHWIKPRVMLDMPHVRRHILNYLGGVLSKESVALWQQSRPEELAMLQDGSEARKR